MIINYKKVFLIDGLGALLSAFLLGIVLVRFEIAFGMPKNVLYALSITACFLAVYSFVNYYFIKENKNLYLKVIAFANLIYCCLTIALMVYFYTEITLLGLIYFLAEIIIITLLASFELKIAKR